MIKLLLLILLGLALTFFGYKTFLSENTSISLPGSNQSAAPADAIEGAKDAAGRTQDLQNKINQEAQEQLDN